MAEVKVRVAPTVLLWVALSKRMHVRIPETSESLDVLKILGGKCSFPPYLPPPPSMRNPSVTTPSKTQVSPLPADIIRRQFLKQGVGAGECLFELFQNFSWLALGQVTTAAELMDVIAMSLS